MACTRKSNIPDCRLTVNGVEIDQKDSFTYLGSLITSDGRSDKDIKCRIGLAKKTFMDMKGVLCEENRTSDQEATLEVLHLVSADVRLRVMDDKQNDAEASRSC